MRGVVIAGFMGVGKSAVGPGLASRLGLPWVDLDALLAQRHGPIARQLLEEGERVFRARERDAVQGVCAGPPLVLSLGGGAWVDASSRRALRQWGLGCVLVAPLPVLASRLGAGVGRPLWAAAPGLLRARAAAYADADVHVDATMALHDVVDELARCCEALR